MYLAPPPFPWNVLTIFMKPLKYMLHVEIKGTNQMTQPQVNATPGVWNFTAPKPYNAVYVW